MKRVLAVCLAVLLVLAATQAPGVGLTAPSHDTVLSISGSGSPSSVRSKTFAIAANWSMLWSYTCSRSASPNFHVKLFKPGGRAASAHEVRSRTRTGSGTDYYKKGGTFYLQIGSHCSWRISVTGYRPPPKPTPTPQVPYTATTTAKPCTTGPLQKGCADLGFTLTENNGVITLAQKDWGYNFQFSKFGVGRTSYGDGYVLFFYVKATKTMPKDQNIAAWSPTAQSFHVTAINGHPYSGGSCGTPGFPDTGIYNGESKEGWVCSAMIDPAYLASTFTWSYSGSGRIGTSYVSYDFPLADVTVTHR